MNVLLEVGGKREKGKASRHLMPQSAVVNGISTIKTRHSILNGKKKLDANSLFDYYLIFTPNAAKLCY